MPPSPPEEPNPSDAALRDEVARYVLARLDQLAAFIARSSRGRGDQAALLQETILRAIRGARSFRGQAKPWTWICAIAENLILEDGRRRGRRRQLAEDLAREPDAALPREERDPAEAAERGETEELMQAALAMLSQSDQELVERHWVDGLSARDLAGRTGRTLEATRSALVRALQRLGEAFRALGGEDPDGP